MTLFILYCLYDYHRSVFSENEHFSLLFRTRPHTEAQGRPRHRLLDPGAAVRPPAPVGGQGALWRRGGRGGGAGR